MSDMARNDDIPNTTARQSTSVAAIDFHGDRIVTFQHQGEAFVAMRRIVENLGLAWAPQHRKLTEDRDRWRVTIMVTQDAIGRPQETIAMPVGKFALWLATIHPNKIPDPARRAKIELYQEESAIALHDYWTKGVAVQGDLDGIVTALDPNAMRAVGGMVKGIIHKEMREAVSNLIPALVAPFIDQLLAERLGSQRYSVVEGMTALDIAEEIGFAKGKRPKGLSQYISGQMTRWQEDRKVPIRRVRNKTKLFDESLAREWVRHGGKRNTEDYVSHRNGKQRQLRLVKTEPASSEPGAA